MSFGLGSVLDFLTSLSLISQVFIAGILAIAVWFNLRFSRKVVDQGPTILTTLGIFGTFLGVAIGLYHFDTANVQASVPALLSGLRTAFWASVFGVGAAVQIKGRDFLFGAGGDDDEAQGDEASPVAVLVDIRNALAGEGDNSLVQQMRLVRQDLNDRLLAQIRLARQDSNERMDAFKNGHRDMIKQMDGLSAAQSQSIQKLASTGAQTLVDALQDVVLSFNDKVASQFGENYRELSQAVRQLVTWQVDYRDTVSKMTDQLAETLRLLGYAASDFKAVTQGSERFAQTAERVGRTMDAMDAGEQRLTDMALALVKLTEEASGRLPFIESRLYQLTSQMTQAVQDNQVALNAALSESMADIKRAIETSQQGFADVARSGAEQVRENQLAIAGALTENASLMTSALQDAQRNLVSAVAGFDEQTGMLMAKSIDKLAQQLSAQMETQKPRPALRLVAEGED